ncbi:hypothetical protein T4D_8936 [Trichinella pseudospiralis]|uniref:Uncharacterized protein n=1 Tax=Trichinella pseudospiralis TaxID=6337 RepID=A0A0V1FA92_TRIPS|nr:hypothetical protein T4D_8936 [Trichinella pseudospiralis]
MTITASKNGLPSADQNTVLITRKRTKMLEDNLIFTVDNAFSRSKYNNDTVVMKQTVILKEEILKNTIFYLCWDTVSYATNKEIYKGYFFEK